MPDITSLLERAAAAPGGAPDIERPLQRKRWARAGAALTVCAVVALVVVVAPGRSKSHVVVSTPPTSAEQQPQSVRRADATIDVLPGWYASDKPLAPWLHSPFELFSISTTPGVQPLANVANCAACASEIPKVAVDAIGTTGAFLWIGEWRPGEGEYEAAPRPNTFDGMVLSPGCNLPHGMKPYIGAFRDGARDFTVSYLIGPDAPASARADIDRMLDTLRLDAKP